MASALFVRQLVFSCLHLLPTLLILIMPFCFQSVSVQVGGWAVSGQWKQTDFNSTLILLMRDYNTFPFFNLYVGKDPNETANGTTKRYIQVRID